MPIESVSGYHSRCHWLGCGILSPPENTFLKGISELVPHGFLPAAQTSTAVLGREACASGECHHWRRKFLRLLMVSNLSTSRTRISEKAWGLGCGRGTQQNGAPSPHPFTPPRYTPQPLLSSTGGDPQEEEDARSARRTAAFV